MIFYFYIFLFIVSLVLIYLGYFSDTDVLKIVAYGMIFMLGFMLISDTPFGAVEDCNYVITYKEITASNETYTSAYSCEPINNYTFGFWVSVLGVLGFASVYLQRKGGPIER